MPHKYPSSSRCKMAADTLRVWTDKTAATQVVTLRKDVCCRRQFAPITQVYFNVSTGINL